MGNASDYSEFISTISKNDDIILGAVYSLLGFLSLCGNSVLLFIAYRKRAMLKPAEYFIVNLSVSDMGMTVTLFPLAIPSLFAHRWLFDKIVCKYYAFCGVLFGLSSLTNLTVLSSVCCLKVCYPGYGNKFSPTHARILLLCVWAYAFVFATAPLADWGSYGPEPYGTACCIDWKASNKENKAISYTIALFVFCYIIPCTLILISYALILLTVKGSRRAVRQHISPQTKVSTVHNLIVKLSIAVCIGFLAAWTPYAIVAMWAALGDADQVPSFAFALCAVCAKSSTLYNPVVYLLFKPNFQQVLTKDLSLFQALCGMVCGRTASSVEPKSRTDKEVRISRVISGSFLDRHGSCRTCDDTFECYSKYPRCCNVTPAQEGAPRPGIPISAVNGESQPALQVMVFAARTKSGGETTNVAVHALPPGLG
ncbi:opsin-5-like [Ambystoma mexicanum]|uniref:opsin-5-like n=1 Tax=Ambystoma mexicanum TaxID=8296 RepID=UPI0037E8411F